uniref:Secreted protein n=1 Tax=Anopheles darlingi TaxID=43151 RepID=A0A2M4D5K8_ANODA
MAEVIIITILLNVCTSSALIISSPVQTIAAGLFRFIFCCSCYKFQLIFSMMTKALICGMSSKWACCLQR